MIKVSRTTGICSTHVKRLVFSYVRMGLGTTSKANPVLKEAQTASKIVNVTTNDSQKMMHVTWENGTTSRFLYIWMRDNSPDPQTYNLSEICKARIMLLKDLDLDVKPVSLENTDDQIFVKWSDGTESIFKSTWLIARRLDEGDQRARRKEIYINDHVTWTSNEYAMKLMKWFSLESILTNDLTLHQALTDLCTLGLIFIKGEPEKGQLAKISQRIGFEYLTHYGNYFTVKNQIKPTNLAYGSKPLGFHTDLPYLQYAPQIQALHCIKQTTGKGGENQFVDAFKVAEIIKRDHPQLYKILCQVPLEYVDDGQDYISFDSVHSRPVFNFDPDGCLSEVHFSNQQRSWFYDVPLEKLHDVYKALITFNNALNKREYKFEIRLNEGDVVLFHNLRVLHARSGFRDEQVGQERAYEGCYFNFDIVKSKIRLLRDQLNLEPNQISV